MATVVWRQETADQPDQYVKPAGSKYDIRVVFALKRIGPALARTCCRSQAALLPASILRQKTAGQPDQYVEWPAPNTTFVSYLP